MSITGKSGEEVLKEYLNKIINKNAVPLNKMSLTLDSDYRKPSSHSYPVRFISPNKTYLEAIDNNITLSNKRGNFLKTNADISMTQNTDNNNLGIVLYDHKKNERLLLDNSNLNSNNYTNKKFIEIVL